METIEIRARKRSMHLFIGLMTAGLVGMVFLVFRFNSYSQQLPVRIFLIGSMLYCFYGLYKAVKKVNQNRPVITLTSQALSLDTPTGVKTFAWQAIQEASIHNEVGVPCLKVQALGKEASINIPWMERKADEIQALIDGYRNHAASQQSP